MHNCGGAGAGAGRGTVWQGVATPVQCGITCKMLISIMCGAAQENSCCWNIYSHLFCCVCVWCVCVCGNWCVPLANNAKLALFIYANGCGQEAPLAARNAGCSQCQHGEQLCCFPHCPPRPACPSYSPRMVFRADCFIIMCLRFTKTMAPKESIMMARMAPSRMMNHGCVNTSFTWSWLMG